MHPCYDTHACTIIIIVYANLSALVHSYWNNYKRLEFLQLELIKKVELSYSLAENSFISN